MGNLAVRLSNRFGFIESKIDIIYDAEKALQHKHEMDKAISDYEKWEKKQDKTKLALGLFLFAVFCVALVVFDNKEAVFAIACAGAILVGFAATAWNNYVKIGRPPEEYTADIKYFLATEGKRILRITVDPTPVCFPSVRIVTENADHSTTKTEIFFKVVERTDLHQIVLDVNEGVVYVPYERENGRRC